MTEGLLYESSKTAILKIYSLFKTIPTTLRATSIYTRDALILIPAKPKNWIYRNVVSRKKKSSGFAFIYLLFLQSAPLQSSVLRFQSSFSFAVKHAVKLFAQCVYSYQPEKLYSQKVYYYTYYKYSERNAYYAEYDNHRVLFVEKVRNAAYHIVKNKRIGVYKINSERGGRYKVYELFAFFSKLSFEKKIKRKTAQRIINGEVY